jgi:hypothetical protein
MTYGTSANLYLLGRQTVPYVAGPAEQTAPIGKGPATQHRRRGLIALTAHFAHFIWPAIPPNEPQRPPPKRAAREISFASAARKPATHRGKMLKLINGHLDHLRETKDLFDHLRETKDLFGHLARSSPLIRLVRFLRTFLQATQPR